MNIDKIISTIQSYQANEMPETIPGAAVLILFVYSAAEVMLVITKRADSIAYAGDFCFPGGMQESDDANLLATVRREIYEELGIDAEHYQIIGQVDDFLDRYDQRVRPYVAIMEKNLFVEKAHKVDQEVAAIHFFPLEDLKLFATSRELQRITQRRPSYFYVQDDVTIWGLTASIMVHLGNILLGLVRPVGKKNLRKNND